MLHRAAGRTEHLLMNHVTCLIPARQIAYLPKEISVALNGRGHVDTACLTFVADSNFRVFIVSYFQRVFEFIYLRLFDIGPAEAHASFRGVESVRTEGPWAWEVAVKARRGRQNGQPLFSDAVAAAAAESSRWVSVLGPGGMAWQIMALPCPRQPAIRSVTPFAPRSKPRRQKPTSLALALNGWCSDPQSFADIYLYSACGANHLADSPLYFLAISSLRTVPCTGSAQRSLQVRAHIRTAMLGCAVWMVRRLPHSVLYWLSTRLT